MLSRRCASTTTYAVAGSNGDGSIMLTVAHSGIPGIFDVTFVQLRPASRVTCTRPSSLPAQITPACRGDSASAKTVSYVSTPVLSPVMGPPDHFCFDLSLRVRSGLIASHVWPPSFVLKIIWAA
jgi:hypothetical protein